jgi:cell division protein YceG involved in septum cleavage
MIKRKTSLASAILLASFLAALFYYLFLPLKNSDSKVEIIIPRGATAASIADSLKNHKIITSSTALRFWMKLKGTERRIQAGKITQCW